MSQDKVDEDEILELIVDMAFKRCLVCNKYLDKNDPYIIAYNNDIPAYFCREHVDDAKHYLDWYQKFVEVH